ncbi:hypothetical protein COCCADRAFT_40308 [Bipolaris zeicola 26-R-13]|uniref:Tyrosinase copper-binding domain-containing protein n=1 Tax=Cochliobolus carbonum (strain 26-R-13) TaxID=930089 RepID=W6Y2N7_COCC2|nr:uncharacterized protein COCCADRAFT_40308 [Bipolaris zeicola 26-R-13]EUC29314.1 hypothetical protein COCCADRAFT_40308 [Bipolaris zeicola 26-R-13]
MRFLGFPTAVLALASVVESAALQRRDVIQDLQNQAIAALKEAETNGSLERRSSCSVFNAPVRRNWDHLSKKERREYISAVKCLQSLPSKSDPALVPGAKTRFDDFVGQHINQTRSIHGTGNFLTWHRYFTFAYEKTLRQECGYTGYQPYWNWFSYQDDVTKSPVFDGSDTSLGGDGSFVAHNGSVAGGGTIFLPSGNGGGCIKSGPFQNVQINLGPVSPAMAGEPKVAQPLDFNPRCAKRDITSYAAKTWLTNENLLNVTIGAASKNIGTFQDELQGRFGDGFLGLHASGHYTMGGDGGDFYSSPNDPVFYLHHAMVDRVWWIWQALHLDQANTIAGNVATFQPNSAKTTLKDIVQMNWLNIEPKMIEELLDTPSAVQPLSISMSQYIFGKKHNAMTTSISIIGAGIAGLTLGRSLLRRGIPAILYEKAALKPRFNYGITLHATAYKPLLKLLDIDEDAFKRRVAVDADNDGYGKIGSSVELPSHDGLYDIHSSFRANKNKLEQLLREGLDIRWEHSFESIEPASKGTKLQFQNGETNAANIVIAADGVHSSIRRLLLPSAQPSVLPYTVFNGKKKLDRETFDKLYAPAMREANVIEAKHDDVVLNISVNEKKAEEVSISWIYSRGVRSDSDPLHQPNRSKEDAKKIPEQLFEEAQTLNGLQPPFSEVFDAQKMRSDRILHWLMRTLLPPLSDIQRLSEDTGVCFIGEAVHAEPIVGGNGANAAILDALSLAEQIANGDRAGISNWYKEMYPVWTKGVERSRESIANVHRPVKSVSGNL